MRVWTGLGNGNDTDRAISESQRIPDGTGQHQPADEWRELGARLQDHLDASGSPGDSGERIAVGVERLVGVEAEAAAAVADGAEL